MSWMPDAEQHPSAPLGNPPGDGPIRLLAVDDEPAVLRSLRSLFRGGAYELHLADNGPQALTVLREQPIDVIISDMRMPGMDGMELLSEVRRRFPEPMRIVLSGYAEPDRVIGVLNEAGIFAYVHKPWDNADLKLKVHRAVEQLRLKQLTERQNAELARLNSSLEDKVRARTSQLQAATERLLETMHELDESYRAVVKMLAHVAELRIPASQRQSQRVARTARIMAQDLGLSSQQVKEIETAALLQNIGMMVIPDEILALTPERMNGEQRAQYRRHPVLGEITLVGIPVMRQVAAIIRSHHEFFDGHGFPDGLAGEAIPLGARVIRLVNDYYELLDAERTGELLTEQEAHARLRHDAGHRYDPRLVELFGRLGQGPVASGGFQVEEVCTLYTEDLKPGMVLYERLLSKDGMLLLTAGQRVSQHAIDAIRRLERSDGSRYLLYVYEREEDAARAELAHGTAIAAAEAAHS